MTRIDMQIMHPAFQAYDAFYTMKSGEVAKLIDENEKYIDQLDAIKNLLVAVSQGRKTSKDLDFSKDPAKKALVDAIKNINPDLITGYQCKEKDIDGFIELLNNEAKQITSRINPINLEINEVLQQRNRVTEIMTEIVRIVNEEASYMVKNQASRGG